MTNGRSHSWLIAEEVLAPQASQCSFYHALMDERISWVDDAGTGISGPRWMVGMQVQGRRKGKGGVKN